MSDDCPICCLPFTKVNRKRVTCSKCDYSACSECNEQFILSRPDPSCMNCNSPYSNSLIMETFKKSFYYGKYKDHVAQSMVDAERARLPEAQAWINRKSEINEKQKELAEMRREYIRLDREISRELYQLNTFTGLNKDTPKFTVFCPYDGCRGILNSRWKCSICENTTCSKCHELKIKGEEHICNEDNIKSAEAIKKDSKPCPNCGIYIYKIVGCNQMWCTECNTAFDWRSGRIITGQIHNPHFFEARRRVGVTIGRDANDIPCGGLPSKREVLNAIGLSEPLTIEGFYRAKYNSFLYVVDLVCSMEGLEILNSYTEKADIRERITRLNIDYLLKIIDENEYRSKLFHFEKGRHYNADNANLIRTVITILTDFLRQLVTKSMSLPVFNVNLCEIINYYNCELEKIQLSYKRSPSWFIHIDKQDLDYLKNGGTSTYNNSPLRWGTHSRSIPTSQNDRCFYDSIRFVHGTYTSHLLRPLKNLHKTKYSPCDLVYDEPEFQRLFSINLCLDEKFGESLTYQPQVML